MASKFAQDIPLNDLTAEQFIAIAAAAAKNLGWTIRRIDPAGFEADTKISASSWGEKVQVTVNDHTAHLKSECTQYQLVDWGKNKKNIESLINAVNETEEQYSPEQLTEAMKITQQEQAAQPALKTTSPGDKFTSVLSIFVPVKGYFVTPILINLNVAVFIIMAISGVDVFEPTGESLLKWGANLRTATLDGGWWRLLTCCFLHIGLVHLLLNMYALVYIGVLLEPRIGAQRFLAAYMLTGIAASVTSLYWHSFTISAGASGAIFGMYGFFLALLTTNLVEKTARRPLLASMAIFVGYNLVYGMQGGIDNAAHIGGLLCGLIAGYLFFPSLKNPVATRLKYGTIGLLALLVFAVSSSIYKKMPNDIAQYDARMKEFSVMEEKALRLYQLTKDDPREKFLSVTDSGLYNWKESIKLLHEVDQMDIPGTFHEHIQKLIEYCNLRIKSYTLMYKAIDENSEAYTDSLNYYNKEIEAILNSLKEK